MSFKITDNGISRQLEKMASRAQLARGWLNRVAYPKIIEAQRLRWVSQNTSEGKAWEPINTLYAIRKLTRFRDYPGGGRHILIATSRLVKGMTGDNKSDHYKLVTETRIEVGTLVAYAKWVNEDRDITSLGDRTVKGLIRDLQRYLAKGA